MSLEDNYSRIASCSIRVNSGTVIIGQMCIQWKTFLLDEIVIYKE